MNSQNISYKLKTFSAAIILLITLSIIYSCTIIYNKNTFYPTVNKGRILVNSEKTALEKCMETKDFKTPVKCKFKYAVVNLDGKILASSIDNYKKNDTVNLHEFIEYGSSFSLKNPNIIKFSEPLIINNIQVGTAVFLIPKKNFLVSSPLSSTIIELIPIAAFLILTIILSICLCIFIKNNVLIPLINLNDSTKKILNGDFSCKIKYDYDNEVGTFCHNFEAMRDELKFSKEKEAALKVNEKEFLACISHDIKTPLTAISGYVSGIKDGIVKDREGIEKYCSVILKRVRMLSKLLEDILESSKAELNKMNMTFAEFYCGKFFKDILEDISLEVQGKGLKFIEPQNVPNLLINADKKRLSQVIYNLVSNSIKYSKDNGTISMYFETEKNYLKVYVKDTGIGIVSDDVPFIFNKFYRGEKCRNQNIPGSGLGLSISKYIVEAHGGFISCVESSSKGTTMCFGIPI